MAAMSSTETDPRPHRQPPRRAAPRDFRRLFAMRLVSQSADGLIQAALVASLVFSPERATTAASFALASAIVIVPFSVIGPFVGVFIDRWSRRRIMVVAPLLRAAPVFLVLASPTRQAALYYGGALFVTSVNRFFLATAQAVVPRLVPTEDLLAANSIATVGGTVALLVGVFAGGLVADAFGTRRDRRGGGGDVGRRVAARARHRRATCGRCSCPSRPSCCATRCGVSPWSSSTGSATSCTRRGRSVRSRRSGSTRSGRG